MRNELAPVWLQQDVKAFASGKIWDVRRLAAKYGISPVNAKCWFHILSQKQNPIKRLNDCPYQKKRMIPSAHESNSSAAHTLRGFKIENEMDEFSHRPSDSEMARVRNNQPGARAPATAARGRGTDGRGSGRGGRAAKGAGAGAGKGAGRGGRASRRGGQHFRQPGRT